MEWTGATTDRTVEPTPRETLHFVSFDANESNVATSRELERESTALIQDLQQIERRFNPPLELHDVLAEPS